jgi:hypothetical protein
MNICTNPQIANVVLGIGVAAHAITLFVDYWLGVAKSIESNSIVELFLSLFKKKKPEAPNGK